MEDAAAAANNVIECVNENLHNANFVVETTPGFLPNAEQLQAIWKQGAKERAEAIRRVTRLNWETYWQYLVKLHNQWMTLRCLITFTEKMVPTLTNVVFVGKLKAEVGQPTPLKHMLDIFDLKDQMQD